MSIARFDRSDVAVRPTALLLLLLLVASSCSNARSDTRSGIRQMLVFNSSAADTYLQEAGVIEFVWGADCQGMRCPGTNRAVPGVWHEYYIPWSRDGVGSVHSIEWFVEYHPDWILYTAPICRGRSTFKSTECVAYTPKAATNEVTVPLDFTNPEVQDYIFREWIDPNMSSASPFNGISWDDQHSEKARGHWTRSGGAWVEKYNGTDGPDPAWSTAQTSAFKEMRERFKRSYPSGSWSFNAGYFPYEYVVDWPERIRIADHFMHEGGFTQRFITESDWLWLVETLVKEQSAHDLGVLLVNQLTYPLSKYQTDVDARARADVLWALANYLLIRSDRTYFWIGGVANYGDGPAALQQREFDPALADINANAIGDPVDKGRGAAFHVWDGVYRRDFSNGLSIVNPSGTWHAVNLPAVGTFRDVYGREIAERSLRLPPRSGVVLIGR